jgi:predicted ribosomally synthesized peptide with nif11-like leader
MANQDVKSFLDAVELDPTLKAELKGSLDEIVNTAQLHGFSVSRKDLADELGRRYGINNSLSYHDDPDTCTTV